MAKMVKVYSTSTCPYCIKLKDFFKKNAIVYEAFDVGSNQEALNEMKEKSGQLGVPVTDIDGTIIVGFDKNAIITELGL